MADNDRIRMQLERWRTESDADKGGLFSLTSGRAVEARPTNVFADHCEICGTPFGDRIYYDNASAKDTGFCSPQHVQIYRERRKIKLAAPPKATRRPWDLGRAKTNAPGS